MKKAELIKKANDLKIYWDTAETSTVNHEKSVFNICIPDGLNNNKLDLGKISQAYNTFRSKAEEDNDMYFYNLTQDEFWQVLEILFD